MVLPEQNESSPPGMRIALLLAVLIPVILTAAMLAYVYLLQ
jgi:hypothetical protein